MFDKLIGVEERFVEVEKQLSDPKIINDRNAYQTYVREHAELSKIVTVYRRHKQTLLDIDESQELLKDADPEIKDLARDEIATLNRVKENLEAELKKLLLPKDPNDDKNVIVEIRAGAGGDAIEVTALTVLVEIPAARDVGERADPQTTWRLVVHGDAGRTGSTTVDIQTRFLYEFTEMTRP